MTQHNEISKKIRIAKTKLEDVDAGSVEYKMKHKAIREMERQKRDLLNTGTAIRK